MAGCEDVVLACSVEDSAALEDSIGLSLTSCFCWIATDDGIISIVVVVGGGAESVPVVVNEQSAEGPSLGSFHCKLPALIP